MSGDALFACGRWSARPLRDDDAAALEALLQRCADYFQLVFAHPPGPAEAQSLVQSLPPGHSYDDKFVLVVEVDAQVVGVVDLLRGYPAPASWMLGLVLLDPAVRNAGIGAELVHAVRRHVASCGGEVVRAAIAQHNPASLRFFERQGFAELERKPFRFGLTTGTVVVLTAPALQAS